MDIVGKIKNLFPGRLGPVPVLKSRNIRTMKLVFERAEYTQFMCMHNISLGYDDELNESFLMFFYAYYQENFLKTVLENEFFLKESLEFKEILLRGTKLVYDISTAEFLSVFRNYEMEDIVQSVILRNRDIDHYDKIFSVHKRNMFRERLEEDILEAADFPDVTEILLKKSWSEEIMRILEDQTGNSKVHYGLENWRKENPSSVRMLLYEL